MSSNIASALYSQASAMSASDAGTLRQLLNVAASGLNAERGLPKGRQRAAVDTLLSTLFLLGAGMRDVPRNGILWLGRPSWVTDESIRQLLTLAAQAASQRVPRGSHTFVECPAVWEVFSERALVGLLRELGQDVRTVERAPTFQYFDAEGQRAEPHVDVQHFYLTMIMMLRHDGEEKRSKLWVFPAGGEPEPIEIRPGEMVLMHGNCVVHERSAVAQGEIITTLGIGFTPN